MNQKYLAIAAVVFIVWFSWFFRYEPIVTNGAPMILDRWNGNIFNPFHEGGYWIDPQSKPVTEE
jgi:hypothetical protein